MNKTAFFLILCFHAYGFSSAESAAAKCHKKQQLSDQQHEAIAKIMQEHWRRVYAVKKIEDKIAALKQSHPNDIAEAQKLTTKAKQRLSDIRMATFEAIREVYSQAKQAPQTNSSNASQIIEMTTAEREKLFMETYETNKLLLTDKQVPEPPKTEPDTFKREDLFMFIFDQPNK